MKIPTTKAERIAHYRALIKLERKNDYGYGMCIKLGEMCGGYYCVPWTGWIGLLDYYPELSVYKGPKNMCFTERRRKKVIESLALRINKKKDTSSESIFIKKKKS